MKLNRQMGIISFLMDHQKTTAKKLADVFQVSTRTIMRDIDDLTLLGIPLYVTQGKNGGIFLLDLVKLDKPPLTNMEINSVNMGLKSRHQVLADDTTFNAILKLNTPDLTNDFDIDLSLSKGNIELREIIFQLLNAIRESKKITFLYINAKGITSKKRCEPYRVVFNNRSCYLDAYDEEKEAFRVFKVARLTQLNIQGAFTKKPFTPKVYSDAPWMNQDKISVTIHVHKKIIDQFVERLGNDAIHSINDELYEVVYPLHDNEWGYQVLLKYGSLIKIISPNSFVENFIAYLDTIRNQY